MALRGVWFVGRFSGTNKVAPFWSGKRWALDEIAESFARKLAQHENGLDFQAIVLKKTGELIGFIGFQLYGNGEIEQYMIFENEASRVEYDPEFTRLGLLVFWITRVGGERDSSAPRPQGALAPANILANQRGF